ncbi:flavodoxin domain-containing protein [Clostridium sp. LBM24168]
MRTVVVYRSKTGFTKKYAKWIAEELSADIFEFTRVTVDMIVKYDTVIYGGGLYAVSINGIKFITQNLDKIKGKKIVVFATGASPLREEVMTEIRDKNFTPEQQKYICFFYLRGGFDYSRLNIFDKLLMKLLKLTLRFKKNLTADEKGIIAMYAKSVDFTRKDNIKGIIEYIKNE